MVVGPLLLIYVTQQLLLCHAYKVQRTYYGEAKDVNVNTTSCDAMETFVDTIDIDLSNLDGTKVGTLYLCDTTVMPPTLGNVKREMTWYLLSRSTGRKFVLGSSTKAMDCLKLSPCELWDILNRQHPPLDPKDFTMASVQTVVKVEVCNTEYRRKYVRYWAGMDLIGSPTDAGGYPDGDPVGGNGVWTTFDTTWPNERCRVQIYYYFSSNMKNVEVVDGAPKLVGVYKDPSRSFPSCTSDLNDPRIVRKAAISWAAEVEEMRPYNKAIVWIVSKREPPRVSRVSTKRPSSFFQRRPTVAPVTPVPPTRAPPVTTNMTPSPSTEARPVPLLGHPPPPPVQPTPDALVQSQTSTKETTTTITTTHAPHESVSMAPIVIAATGAAAAVVAGITILGSHVIKTLRSPTPPLAHLFEQPTESRATIVTTEASA